MKLTGTLAAVLLSVCLGGCGMQPETLSTLREVVNTVSAKPSDSAETLADAAPAKFQPAHPERVDPFAFPANAPIDDAAGTTITTVAQVEVLGFADVDHPRVFLRTKELTRSLKVGDMIDGVVVVAINPPSVELKMGTLIWTASMFDGSTSPQ